MMYPSERIRFFQFRPSVLILAIYWLVIFVATHIPISPGTGPPVNDKTAHRVAYFGLSLLLCLVLRSYPSWKVVVTVAVIGCLYAGFDEWSQSFVPGRQPDLYDWIADLTGIAAGLVLFAVLSLVPGLRRKQARRN